MNKLVINGKKHFFKTTKKYLNALLSILATLPQDEGFKEVNIRNNALLMGLDITFEGERGYKSFLLDNGLVELSKLGKMNHLTKHRTCNMYKINFYNICNFLVSISLCKERFIKLRSIKALAIRPNLPNDIRLFFLEYFSESTGCLKEFEEGLHYDVETVESLDDTCICQLDDDIDSIAA